MRLRGKCSWFGGPNDTGVSPDEGLAFIYDVSDAPHLFLPYQPEGTTGLARRLNPDTFYIACRWDYDDTSKEELLDTRVLVTAIKTGRAHTSFPADWGPHEDTDRVADISPGLMSALGIQTDDEVEVVFSENGEPNMSFKSVAISSGHGLYVRGASGILDEVDEAREVVNTVVDYCRSTGIDVKYFHDNISTSQNENLNTIVNFHNAQTRDLDISIHFNAYEDTNNPMGTEVLYVTQSTLAADVSAAISDAGGFIDRGAKKRTDLFFLNNTEQPAILIETCFVDSSADAELYRSKFNSICRAIVEAIKGETLAPEPPHPEIPPEHHPSEQHVDIVITAPHGVIVNVTQMTTGQQGISILRRQPGK